VGLPWGVLLEGHGWWHLGTGFGAVSFSRRMRAAIDSMGFNWLIRFSQYCYIVWGIWLRHCLNGRQDEFELVWPRILSVPVVVKRDSKQAAAAAGNGHIKKTT
jgi:dihydroceramidase